MVSGASHTAVVFVFFYLSLCLRHQVKDDLRSAVYNAVVALLGDADIVVQVRM